MPDTGTEIDDPKAGAAAGPPKPQEQDRGGLDAEPPEIVQTPPFEGLDRYSTKSLDRAANAHLARFTLGISPYGLSSTFFT